MKSYEGDADGEVYVVEGLRRTPLSLHLELRNHSPDGFAWGYGGSGPSQLALAILANLVGDKKAVLWYQPFKWRWIAQLQREEPWSLSEKQIKGCADRARTRGAQHAIILAIYGRLSKYASTSFIRSRTMRSARLTACFFIFTRRPASG